MRKINLKVFTLLMTLLMLSSVNVFAQKEGTSTKKEVTRKVVIVEKTKDKDGKIVVKRIEKEGEEATKYLKEMKIEDKDGKIIEVDIDINEIKTRGNHIEVFEIDNCENASEEIKKKLKDLDIDLEILDDKLKNFGEKFEIIELEENANRFEIMGLDKFENHLLITPKKGEGEKVETIEISVEDDKYEVKIVVDGQEKNYKWEGDIPANVKQEIEALGFDVEKEKAANIAKWLDDSGDNIRIKVGKDKKVRFFNSENEVHIGFPNHDEKHLKIEPTDKIKDKVENINININDDEYNLDIKMNGQEKKYNWKGEIPENIKKELTEMGFKVSMEKSPSSGHRVSISDESADDGVFLGIQMGDKRSDLGVLIDGVVEGSAAEAAGLQAGDIITAIGDKSTIKFKDLVAALDGYKVGDKAVISYIRGDNTAKTTVSFEKGASNNQKMKFKSFDSDEMEMEFEDDFEFKMDDENFPSGIHNKVILGVFLDTKVELEKGVQLSGVIKDGGAEKVGLQKGDIVLEVDGQAITKDKGIGELIKDKQEGDEVKVKYTREGVEKMATITLTKSKEPLLFIKKRLVNFPSKHGKRKVIIIRKKGEKADIIEEEIIEMEEDNALDLEAVKVFPNPTEGQLTVEFQAEAAPTTIVVRDVSGKEIFKETLTDFGGNYKKQIDVQNAASGILVVTVQQGEKVFNIKVLKN